ncbi:hypothetical protein [Allofrancisella frigidaquae]|uniref:Uncharacterized protein n=1 Tax=Allofrancisella frigidaquae TaxID=1085644 RepID=A0A6M3HTJ1_9GAMM|nr:hypothetical protein [Allofrancisella frigidaquae]QIV94350.1 hypothetical protein E3E15_02845 [Allofrancisella frigidaquae]
MSLYIKNKTSISSLNINEIFFGKTKKRSLEIINNLLVREKQKNTNDISINSITPAKTSSFISSNKGIVERKKWIIKTNDLNHSSLINKSQNLNDSNSIPDFVNKSQIFNDYDSSNNNSIHYNQNQWLKNMGKSTLGESRLIDDSLLINDPNSSVNLSYSITEIRDTAITSLCLSNESLDLLQELQISQNTNLQTEYLENIMQLSQNHHQLKKMVESSLINSTTGRRKWEKPINGTNSQLNPELQKIFGVAPGELQRKYNDAMQNQNISMNTSLTNPITGHRKWENLLMEQILN